MIELPEMAAELSLLRLELPEPGVGQAIENAQLLFPQPLVDDKPNSGAGSPPGREDALSGLTGSHVWRCQYDVSTMSVRCPASSLPVPRQTSGLARISHTHYDSCTIASRSIALSN